MPSDFRTTKVREMCLYDTLLLKCEVVALTPEMNLENSILYIEKNGLNCFILRGREPNTIPHGCSKEKGMSH